MSDPETILSWIDGIAKVLAACGVVFGIWRGIRHLQISDSKRELELEQARRANGNEEARLWLELRKRFDEHKEIHLLLRDDKWPDDKKTAPWPDLEAYLGLFEHCEAMLEKGLLDIDIFVKIYGYRLGNVFACSNEVVRSKVRGSGWELLQKLYHRIQSYNS